MDDERIALGKQLRILTGFVESIAICMEVEEDQLGYEYLDICRQTFNQLEEGQSITEMITIIAAAGEPILKKGREVLSREEKQKNMKKLVN